MRYSIQLRRAAAASAAAVLVAACRDATGPRNSTPSAREAMNQLERGFAADTLRGTGSRADYIAFGFVGLVLGADVHPLTVSLDGRAAGFNSVSYAETSKDSIDANGDSAYDAVGYDSTAVTLAWRGDSAQEVIYVMHGGYTGMPTASRRARALLERLARRTKEPLLARAALRAADAAGLYGLHRAGYLTATDEYYSAGDLDTATAALTVGAAPCATREALNAETDYFLAGLEAGDSCTRGTLTTGYSGRLYPGASSAGTRRLVVPAQTVSAPRLFIDYTDDHVAP